MTQDPSLSAAATTSFGDSREDAKKKLLHSRDTFYGLFQSVFHDLQQFDVIKNISYSDSTKQAVHFECRGNMYEIGRNDLHKFYLGRLQPAIYIGMDGMDLEFDRPAMQDKTTINKVLASLAQLITVGMPEDKKAAVEAVINGHREPEPQGFLQRLLRR